MPVQYLRLQEKLVSKHTVLLRLDVNEPVLESGELADDFRIRSCLPTIHFLQKLNTKIVIVAHLGRPEGKQDKKLSLRPAAKRMAELLNIKFVESANQIPWYPVKHLVFFTGDIQNEKNRFVLRNGPFKDIIFLENIRFYPGEEKTELRLAKQLSELADVYVNDAFGCSHREAASITGVTKYLPGYAGLLLEKECKALTSLEMKPKQPLIVMMAGIKISEKAKALEKLAEKAEKILLGGGLANLMFLALGYEIGYSRVEKEGLSIARKILKNFKTKIVLPEDVVTANKELDRDSILVKPSYKVGKREIITDIGPKSILQYAKILKTAKTLIWNGPLGHFEVKPFDTATMALAKVVGGVSKGKCFGVVGGGETVDAVRLSGQIEFIDHVSTGGGAMLEYLAGTRLPGVVALEKNNHKL